MFELSTVIRLLILKSTPQDLPYSTQLLTQWLLIYGISGFIIIQTTTNSQNAISALLLSLAIHYLFIYIVLKSFSLHHRLVQTFLAVIASSCLFNGLAWLLITFFSPTSTDSPTTILSLAFLLLTSWELWVKTFIFKHAFEVKMTSALAFSFALFFINLTLTQLILPINNPAT